VHIERQMLFLLTLQNKRGDDARPCWDVRNCSMEWKHALTAQLGNSKEAVFAGSSMGPFVWGNLRPTGAAR
jgi:hypothetical protein